MTFNKLVNISFFISIILISITNNSCQETSSKTDTISNVSPSDTFKVNGQFNDIARFIAGMPIKETSEIYKLTQINSWKDYCSKADTVWAEYNNKTRERVYQWASSEIPEVNKTNKTVFYPFSGADFLYAGNMFPKADKYIMLAREGVGVIPSPELIYKDSATFFATVDTAIHDVLSLSYFKTIDMYRELNNENISGTLPVLMLFAVRTGYTIIDIKPLELNKDGEIDVLKEFKKYEFGEKLNKGAQITLKHNKTAETKTIIYFCEDISDEGIAKNVGLQNFLKNLDTNLVTYLKSASYLMHKSFFKTIRNTVIDKSKVILQDDSGIPYKFYNTDNYTVTLYGTFEKPFHLFKGYYTEDLKKAYETKNPKALDFSIGYNIQSNMQLIIKK